MTDKVRCPYCGESVLNKGLDYHIKCVCKNAPAEARQSEIENPSAMPPTPIIDSTMPRLSMDELGVPTPDEYFVISDSIYAELERTERMSKSHPINILVTGAQGGGKTSLAMQFAARKNRPFVGVQCGLMSEPGQWFGGLKFTPERGTYFQESQFVRGVETPRCTILLDELNRVENPKVMNSLFWLLDTRRQAWIDDLQRRVTVAPEVVFIATLNEGSIFSGVDFVDTALRDRFVAINLEFPPEQKEREILVKKIGCSQDAAEKLVKLATILRNNPNLERKVSTRQLLMAAEEIKYGAPFIDAVKFCMSDNYRENEQEFLQAVQAFLPEDEARGGKKETWLAY